jgi:hypothetical protein
MTLPVVLPRSPQRAELSRSVAAGLALWPGSAPGWGVTAVTLSLNPA